MGDLREMERTGNIRNALIRGYYDESYNYIVEIDANKLKDIVSDEFKDFATNIQTKIKLYDLIKLELTQNLNHSYNEFVIDLIGLE